MAMNRADKCRRQKQAKKTAKAKGGAPGHYLQDIFQKGIQAHQAGQLPEASAIYQQILDIQPDHADASHLLGVIAYQTGNHKTAAQLISKAIRHDPSTAAYHCNLGNARAFLRLQFFNRRQHTLPRSLPVQVAIV